MINIDEIINEAGNLTILYVEDCADAREMTVVLFSDIFKYVFIAQDGKEGLEIYKNNKDKIDLIITDVNMPNMDGLEMSKAIKLIDDTPIILLTALTDISILKKAIDIGVDGFLNKPLEDISLLFTKLDMIIKKINYEKSQKQREKVKLLFDMVQNLSHHWRQPLSIVSMISSRITVKVENNIPLSKKDFKDIDLITQKVQELSDMFEKFQNIDFDSDITLDDIEDIIHVSNEIYK